MSQLKIGAFTFTVLEQRGQRLLLSWTEASGVTKERWVNLGAIKL